MLSQWIAQHLRSILVAISQQMRGDCAPIAQRLRSNPVKKKRKKSNI
jgi:hypothetical protein